MSSSLYSVLCAMSACGLFPAGPVKEADPVVENWTLPLVAEGSMSLMSDETLVIHVKKDDGEWELAVVPVVLQDESKQYEEDFSEESFHHVVSITGTIQLEKDGDKYFISGMNEERQLDLVFKIRTGSARDDDNSECSATINGTSSSQCTCHGDHCSTSNDGQSATCTTTNCVVVCTTSQGSCECTKTCKKQLNALADVHL